MFPPLTLSLGEFDLNGLLIGQHGRYSRRRRRRRRRQNASQERLTGSCTPMDPMSLSLLLVILNLNFVRKINVSVSVLLFWKIKQEQLYSARRPQKSWL